MMLNISRAAYKQALDLSDHQPKSVSDAPSGINPYRK